MTNRHRGEIALTIAGGRHVFRLTLQALAEIESALGATGLAGLGQRLAGGLGAADIIRIAAALMRAGGRNLSDGEVGAMLGAHDLPVVIDAIGTLFADAFDSSPSPDPRGPQDARRR